ncbi:MAG: DUF86 domain-containing protein [Nitrospirae bacterium]|nr:MAG: DUF86 domain-containing protein [Nitrospirota bacterium]
MSERPDTLYLNDILDSICAIENFIKDIDFGTFINDRKTRSATIRELEVIGEAAGNISEGLKSLNADVDWRTIKDFRNVLSHEYFGIDDKIVWQIITEKLSPLKNKISVMLHSIE